MRTCAERRKASQQNASAKATKTDRADFGTSREINSTLRAQCTIGNRAAQRMVQTNTEELEEGSASTALPRLAYNFSQIPVHPPLPTHLQGKLRVSTPGNICEEEADRVSERVMRMPEPLQRACPMSQTDQGREHERLQTNRVEVGTAAQISAPPIVHEVLRSPGQPLDPGTRAFMEPRFGHDFGAVRVHTDAAAAASSHELGARAYTVGRHIAFGAGQFLPVTTVGQRLLAHELVHTIQQAGSEAIGPVVQRAMKFEFQTDNVVFRALGSERKPLIPTGSTARKFGPTKFPKHSQWLHKGEFGIPETDKKEGSAIELQSETGSVLEFETAAWFTNWCDLQTSIIEAVLMTEQINNSELVGTSPAGNEIRKWPSAFGTDHLKKTKNFKKGLGSGESLQVEIVEKDWKAAIQASEAVELPQYESLLGEQETPSVTTATIATADKVLNDANTEGTPAADLKNLRGFLQILADYVILGQEVDLRRTDPEPGRASRHPAKAAFSLMSRTSFAAMYRELLSEREQELFRRIVSTDAILDELGLTRSSRFFKHGHGGVPPSEVVTVHAWLRSIHQQGEKRKGKDLLSPPRKGSAAMGKFGVESEPGKKDTGLVKFELRSTADPRHPRTDWVTFAKGLFRAAFTNRNRSGSTALTDPDAPCP